MSNVDLDCRSSNWNVNAADSCGQSHLNLVIDMPPIGIPTPMVYSQITGCCTSTSDKISNKAPEELRKKEEDSPLNQKPVLTLEKIMKKLPKFLDPRLIICETKTDDKTKEETQVMTVFWKDGGETVANGEEGKPLDPCFGFLTALGFNALYPEKILFKPPATIVFWKDGSKTVVKCMEGEHFNEYFGFLAALGKKIFGTNSELNRIIKRGQFPKQFKVPEKPSVVQESPEKKKPVSNSKSNKPASNPKTNKKGAKK